MSRLLSISGRAPFVLAGFILRMFVSRLAKVWLLINGVKFGRNLSIVSFPVCRKHPKASIEIGHNVTISNKLTENLAGITHRSVLYAGDVGARLIIGNNVGMSGVILYCKREIIIEDHVLLGVGAKIYDTDFHPIDAAIRRTSDKTSVKTSPVRICQDVWIGAEATILKGVTIGPRAIVGAHAVVTKDVPADTIVAGIPARVVGKVDAVDKIKEANITDA